MKLTLEFDSENTVEFKKAMALLELVSSDKKNAKPVEPKAKPEKKAEPTPEPTPEPEVRVRYTKSELQSIASGAIKVKGIDHVKDALSRAGATKLSDLTDRHAMQEIFVKALEA